MPATVVAASSVATLWAFRETRRPPPYPRDSLRTRYALDDDALWTRYQQGFLDEIVRIRRTHFLARLRTTLFMAVLYWPLLRD